MVIMTDHNCQHFTITLAYGVVVFINYIYRLLCMKHNFDVGSQVKLKVEDYYYVHLQLFGLNYTEWGQPSQD